MANPRSSARLLYDSKMIFEDQLAALEADSKKVGTQGQEIDFALLVDGLAAEREQGITIDVAYRFFATEKRKFIVADTPGHEQYTRNMVTGASTADLAVILIDARKGVLTQTRRHSYLVHLIGIRNIVLAVNKMDLVGYSQKVFDEVVADYSAFAASLGLTGIVVMPISGFKGDNITTRSANMPWYTGKPLIEHLESVEVDATADQAKPFRMPVQWVNRPNLDFRGFCGLISAGSVKPGDAVRILPSGKTSTVTNIVTKEGDLSEAVAGQSITLCLADEVDCSRGDVLVAADDPPQVADQFEVALVWMADEPMIPGRAYWLKLGTQTVSVRRPCAEISGQCEYAGAHGRQDSGIERDRRRRDDHGQTDRVRAVRGKPHVGRVHSDRQDDQRHGGAPAWCTFPCAGRKMSIGRRSTSRAKRMRSSRISMRRCFGSRAFRDRGNPRSRIWWKKSFTA